MFPVDSPAAAVRVRDDNHRAVDEAVTLGADCLVIVCGGPIGRDLPTTRHQLACGIAELADYAVLAGMADL